MTMRILPFLEIGLVRGCAWLHLALTKASQKADVHGSHR